MHRKPTLMVLLRRGPNAPYTSAKGMTISLPIHFLAATGSDPFQPPQDIGEVRLGGGVDLLQIFIKMV